ncbi:hypothetical protein BGZ74_002966 [Mortierella antarctica]|nr:hypothetical protein BGZ74_002966 [Mortierella antarctica]
MYCNNCCLCFPIRGGGMWLSGLVIFVNAVGAIFLFLWGPFFFSSTQAVIFGGFSALQAALAGIAFFGFCNTSYMLIRMYVFITWLIMFLSAARMGWMAFALASNKDQISSGCYGGVNDKGYTTPTALANIYCQYNIDTVVMMFIVGFMVDFVLKGYHYFVVWRYYVRMRLTPGDQKYAAFTYEEALDEI